MPPVSQDQLRPAHPWKRLVAFATDFLIGMCITATAMMIGTQKGLPQLIRLGELTQEELAVELPTIMIGTVMAFFVASLLPLVSALLLSRSGQTPGKALMGLSVRDIRTGAHLPLGTALAREYTRALVILPGILPVMQVIMPLVIGFVTFDLLRSRLLQTFYDRLFGSIVVVPVAVPKE